MKAQIRRTRAEKAWQFNIANKKPKGQLLDQAFHHSTTGSGLQHNNFNQR